MKIQLINRKLSPDKKNCKINVTTQGVGSRDKIVNFQVAKQFRVPGVLNIHVNLSI